MQPWSCGARASAARGVQQLPCVSEVDAERRGLEPGAGGKPWRGHSVREGPGYRARGNRGNRGWGGVARRQLPGDGCPVTRGPAPARALAAVPQRGPRWGGALTSPLHPRSRPPGPPLSPGRWRRPTSARGGAGTAGAGLPPPAPAPASPPAPHRIAPRGSALCRRPPPTAERCGPPNRARAQVGAGEHRAGRGSPGAPGRGCGNTGAIPGRCPRRGRGLGEAWRGDAGPAPLGVRRGGGLRLAAILRGAPRGGGGGRVGAGGCHPGFQKDPAGGRLSGHGATLRRLWLQPGLGGEDAVAAARGRGHTDSVRRGRWLWP